MAGSAMSFPEMVSVKVPGTPIVPPATFARVRMIVSPLSIAVSSLIVTTNVALVVAPFMVKFVVSIM